MEKWKDRMAEIMEIDDPRRACIEMAVLVGNGRLSTEILENGIYAYMAKHGVDLDEMTLYPDGERVLQPEMFSGSYQIDE